jgi:quinol-cytochrome oxidoreductase complex cytochrome b subunit
MDKTEAQGSSSGLAGAMEWVDKRFPATETFEYHMSKYYAPKNFNFWYYFGFLVTARLPPWNTSCVT